MLIDSPAIVQPEGSLGQLARDVLADVPAGLGEAIARRGFTQLTQVQRAVLDPQLGGRDLRISSQTGSGKTLAIGFLIAPALASPSAPARPIDAGARGTGNRTPARPASLVVAPTRELAAQVASELGWLLAPLGAAVCTVVGGTSFAGELRTLARGAAVVVATPGRLVDHLRRGSIDASEVGVVVLDEADSMLDLGFREELEAILAAVPVDRRTHMVSATFSRDVLALADRYQRDAARVEGTAHGRANADIEHVAHLVRHDERGAALVNLLLSTPGERTLVFVRTRADATEVAEALSERGFAARPLHGELDQAERTKTLDAFRARRLTVLVATDVAARGIDVPDVSRVVHFDPPGCADALTHRSGRTGRAGRKGQSVMLVPAGADEHAARMFRRARVTPSWRPAPSADDVCRATIARLRHELLAADPAKVSTPPAAQDALRALAVELLSERDPVGLISSLLDRDLDSGRAGLAMERPCAPMEVTRVEPVEPKRRVEAPRTSTVRCRDRSVDRGAPIARPRSSEDNAFIPFRVTWGQRHGADPRRMLALVCRRGGVASTQIGAIVIGDLASTIEVSAQAAPGFAQAAGRRDARDPRVRIALANRNRACAGSGGSRGRSSTGR